MQREEKQLDMFLENSLIKLNDLKKAIAQMIHKIGKFPSFYILFTKLIYISLNKLQNSSTKPSTGPHFWTTLR